MQDAIDFQRSVARFTTSDAGYIADVLQGVYKIVSTTVGADDESALLLGDFIEALDECDCISFFEGVRDED